MNPAPQPGRPMAMPDMRDPAGGVPPPLLQHVHLTVDFKLPYSPHALSPDQALEMLTKAPHIVRDYPVAWRMLQAPADGTLLFCWQPTAQQGKHFSSDGIVWAAPESGFIQEVRGHRIECYVCEAGFAPPNEPVAARRRVRYRLASGPPGANLTVEQSLELVHYFQAFPNHRVPTRQIPPTQQLHKSMSERRYLEASGVLARKPFMLHDRNNWPRISMPGVQNANMPPQHQGRPSVGPQMPSGQMPHGPGGNPSVGQQPNGPPGAVHIPGPIPPSFMGEYLKEEDNHSYGDALDFVSPRDLSLVRYKQHHDWMEEVLSSPYALSNIRPIKLNLHASGELTWLTDGLWDTKDGKKAGKDKTGKEATTKQARKSGQHISAADVAELQKRANQYREKEEKDIAEMKKEHAAVMSRMAQQKLFADLERRLGDVASDAELQQILQEAEATTGAVIGRRQQILAVAKGGMLKSGEEKMASSSDEFDDYNTNMDTAGEALDFYVDQMEYTSGDVAA